jgi:hypothetical protein
MKLSRQLGIFLLCTGGSFCMNATALDTSGVAQLDTTPPPAEGAISPDQTPPISNAKPAAPRPTMNNNPQGGGTPQTGVMTPTGGNPITPPNVSANMPEGPPPNPQPAAGMPSTPPH